MCKYKTYRPIADTKVSSTISIKFLVKPPIMLKGCMHIMFDIVDHILAVFIFSKAKESTMRVIENEHTSFLLRGRTMRTADNSNQSLDDSL